MTLLLKMGYGDILKIKKPAVYDMMDFVLSQHRYKGSPTPYVELYAWIFQETRNKREGTHLLRQVQSVHLTVWWAFYIPRRSIMLGPFSRAEILLGSDAMEKLRESTVAIFGVGGVGSFTAEAIARCGVGRIILVDPDEIALTNINRQIHSTTKTIGRPKVEVMAERIRDINPECKVVTHQKIYNNETAEELISKEYDYVVDAIDTVSAKIDMVVRCTEMGIPIMSSMGAGNKLDPTAFEVTDIHKTSVCPLAKVMRQELKKRGIKKLKVVYSKECPIKSEQHEYLRTEKVSFRKKTIPGSISFVPSVAGLIIAGEVVKDLVEMK